MPRSKHSSVGKSHVIVMFGFGMVTSIESGSYEEHFPCLVIKCIHPSTVALASSLSLTFALVD